ncbi:ribose-phosphate diphosphokinase subfamily protein [Besnoitia besnoiti]|uniref:ribose-phosphate diphosphokinase n=1 Tax=Besnoitia besnoiti TaxID=94643 RepID=A0A2A9MGS8_BESBE|nr:ribose-phosphate diphosphokinase subfamily protein [Besnoitia besnoiti]PFH34797.1 ribose-phosphate diphosphokinase subfamily protein [Besnoitia besnoiti]
MATSFWQAGAVFGRPLRLLSSLYPHVSLRSAGALASSISSLPRPYPRSASALACSPQSERGLRFLSSAAAGTIEAVDANATVERRGEAGAGEQPEGPGALDGNGAVIKGPYALAAAFAAVLFPFVFEGASERRGRSGDRSLPLSPARATAPERPSSASALAPLASALPLLRHLSFSSHVSLAPTPALCAEKPAADEAAPSQSAVGAESAPAASSDAMYQELCADSSLQLFSGSAHPELAREIAAHLNVTLGRAHVGRYADGECVIKILDEVRGRDVFVIQSTPAAGGDVHSSLMELFLFLTALRRASAKRITAVIPYMPYDRETELSHGDEILTPMAAADLAVLLQVCGADGVMFVDVHNPRMEGFFTASSTTPLPMTNIQPHRLAVKYFKKKELVNPVIVATDNTAGEKAVAFWTLMKGGGVNAGFTTMVCDAPKREVREGSPILFPVVGERSEGAEGSAEGAWNHVGDVAGCDCIIVDDIIDTGEKAARTAKDLQAGGARRIFMLATHGVLSKGSVDRINSSPIQEVVVTNTVPFPSHICCEKLVVLSVGKLMAEAIKRVHEEQSLSSLFDDAKIHSHITERRQLQ